MSDINSYQAGFSSPPILQDWRHFYGGQVGELMRKQRLADAWRSVC
ncbi:hypothetical protein CAGGBEG34_270001 [Candidatus Glomeribacter gigasporarum BEG34]|uniref:Uncharacterized protein n=1 Tax=Candidatus Glomeribacter gigasporarum BEG34 TaxID=1070319 RepID=G2J9Z8_9BURK|nr:hypothetical protein CAGGBEG34_270001 [Candidatus Glomeribacter gigasporarum BEG34]